MKQSNGRKDRVVTVTLKDGTSCQGRLFMTVSTSGNDPGGAQPRKFIYLQVGESSKVVRFNVSEIEHVTGAQYART